MDDDEYLGSLMERAGTTSVAEYSWRECIEGFKQADRDMGSAFHRKLDWMNRAADTYLADNDKMAGFVKKFGGDAEISYEYAKKINQIRVTFGCYNTRNFSSDALKILLAAPKELQEDFMSSDEKVTKSDVEEAKKEYKQIQEDPDFVDIFEKVQLKEITPRQAIEQKKARMPVVPEYKVEEAMTALTGMSWLYAKEYKGTTHDAADILVNEIVGRCEDETDLSIARDRIKWFFEFKDALDCAEPKLREFLKDKPNLTLVK